MKSFLKFLLIAGFPVVIYDGNHSIQKIGIFTRSEFSEELVTLADPMFFANCFSPLLQA